MKIIEATEKDFQKLKDIYLSLLKENPESFADEYNGLVDKTNDYWIDLIRKPNSKIFLAEINNRVVGTGRISFFERFSKDQKVEIPVLHKLGVLKEFRGGGVAKELIKAREEWARNNGAIKIRTYIIADRKEVINIFEKMGYKIVERRDKDLVRINGDRINVIILEKDL